MRGCIYYFSCGLASDVRKLEAPTTFLSLNYFSFLSVLPKEECLYFLSKLILIESNGFDIYHN